MRSFALRFAIVATLACIQLCPLRATEEAQSVVSASETPVAPATLLATPSAKRDHFSSPEPSASASGSQRSSAPGTDEFGRLLGYVTLLAALAGGAIYLIKFGLPMHRNRSKEERKLQVLEMRPLGNRQFLLVVGYEDARMLLGVTPGKIDYLCPLDSPVGSAPDFNKLVEQAEMKSSIA